MFQQEALERYFQFTNERHSIYLKRQRGEPWPWTDDVILQTYKFTEVFRELDKGTIWLRQNWREPFAEHPMLFFNICLYRQFNWIPTAEYIGFQEDWDADNVYQKLSWYKAQGNQLYTNAHMVRGPIEQRDGSSEKLHYTVYSILDNLMYNIKQYEPQPGDTLQSAFNRLVRAYGFGGFVAYEVISDLRWTHYLNTADDIKSWANAGPGAIRGLNRLLGIPAKAGMRQEDAVVLMRELLTLSNAYNAQYMPYWDMRVVEHTLCEFSKYEKVRLGEGRPRMRFIPPHLRNA